MKTHVPQHRPLQSRQIQFEDGSVVTVRIRTPILPTAGDFAPEVASDATAISPLPAVPTDSFDPSI